MKFQRIGTGLPIARIAIFSMLLLWPERPLQRGLLPAPLRALASRACRSAILPIGQRILRFPPLAEGAIRGPSWALLLGAAPFAYAVDEDLPPPADAGAGMASGGGSPAMPESPTLKEDESIPAPSIGDESLPEPSVDRGQEKAGNQVNKAPSDDEIFLPTPNVNDNIYYAPVGTPAPRVTQEDLDWRYQTQNRPAFSLYAGMGFKSYVNPNVTANYSPGYMVGASYRIISLGQTLFLHAFFNYSSYNLGDVASVPQVNDSTQEYGGELELAIGRRFSLYGTLSQRKSLMTAQPPSQVTNENLADANGIGMAPTMYLGLGGRYDFYVIPHGSIGLDLRLSQNLYSVTLAFSMEPVPHQKLSLGYDNLPED